MDDFWRAVMEGEEGLDREAAEATEPMDFEITTRGDKSRGMGCVLDFIEKNPIGVTISRASLSPPPLPLASRYPSPTSGWVLIDLKAYIAGGRTNASTATASTRAGHEIQATLRAARPPRVSHLCVHCPALTPADFGTEPFILGASDDGLVFFQAAICTSYHCDKPTLQDYFVYRPAPPLSSTSTAGRPPSLTRLPQPDPCFGFARCEVGLLRCGDDGGGGGLPQEHEHYVIARLRVSQGRRGDYTQYDLHRFDSREGKWTTEVLKLGPMPPSPGLTFFYHGTHKVIRLGGGGVMGWVDLCRGILLCDVLADHPRLHYIPLPEPGEQELMSEASAPVFRDIAVFQGGHIIRLVEHQTRVRPWSWSNGAYISDDWTVTRWSWNRKVTNNTSSASTSACWEGRWEMDCKIDASQISGSLPELLGQQQHAASVPPLQRLHTGHPKLSLDEGDVVYVLAKVDHRDEKALVLAVNMRDGALQAAGYFGAERMVGISFTYTQYRLSSDYPEITPGKKGNQIFFPNISGVEGDAPHSPCPSERAGSDFSILEAEIEKGWTKVVSRKKSKKRK